MAIINGVEMINFTHKEIPPYIAKYMSPKILSCIQWYREILGCPFNISLANGALTRFDGRKTSEHYVIVNQKSGEIEKPSRAIDGFPDCNVFEAWGKALSCNIFSGVGVYFDTKNNQGEPQHMLHLDLREKPLIWYRDGGKYFYPHKDKMFFEKIFNIFMTHRN